MAHWLTMSNALPEDLNSTSSMHLGQLQGSEGSGFPWYYTHVYIIENKTNLKQLTITIINVYLPPAISFYQEQGVQ